MIVVARGGGAVEDLLPFSDEGLIRAVAKCRTPVVSAIGHEPDQPLLDLVADVRASTPTDAAKLVVPDVAEELRIVAVGRDRLRGAITAYLDREATLLATLRSRPALADPGSLLATRADEVDALRERALRTTRHRLDRATDEIAHHRARARALSPLATLQRGYAVLQGADGHVLTSVADVAAGAAVSVRVADGRIHADVTTRPRSSMAESLSKIPYEEAREELIEVVRRLEAGGTTLEESLALWERGEELATLCQEWLDGARARLDAARGGDAEED